MPRPSEAVAKLTAYSAVLGARTSAVKIRRGGLTQRAQRMRKDSQRTLEQILNLRIVKNKYCISTVIKKNKYCPALLFFLLLFVEVNYCQYVEDKPIAWVGNYPIYESEFVKRYELTPQFRKQVKGYEQTLKAEFLYTLIAEKLWALEAVENLSDTSSSFQIAYSAIEKMFVRDALYRKNILDSIAISQDEIKFGLQRQSQVLHIKYLVANYKTEAENLHGLLLRGLPFDSLWAGRVKNTEETKPVEITYGDMVPSIEDSVYRLQVGGFTKPIYTPEGWHIFYLANKSQNIFDDQTKQEEAAKNVIKKRKEKIFYNRFLQNTLKGAKINFSKGLFDLLAEKIYMFIQGKCVDEKEPRKLPFFFYQADVVEFYNRIGNLQPQANFILFDTKPVTIKQFLSELFFEGLTINSTQKEEIRKEINKKVIEYIKRELLAREGYRLELNLLPDVQNEMRMWKDYYFQQTFVSEKIYNNTVSDSVLHQYFANNYQNKITSEVVRVSYVFNNDVKIIRDVIEKLKTGGNIEELHSQYSLDFQELTSNEWISYTQLKNLLNMSGEIPANEIYGPLKIDGGYLILKINERKEIKNETQSFNSVKNRLKNELLVKQNEQSLLEKTAALTNKYDIKIDIGVLNSAQVTNINLMTIRNIGFGGSITAVPISPPNFKWIELPSVRLKQLP
ncbi:MAG: peptidylprolyl isomerase [Ignavibacteriales bacterium]|nr:peptidylprolyl isomerase [Ignavibacteriales bacterium]